MRDERAVIATLVAWAEVEQAVRVMLLTSNRARSDGSADELSDYDIVVAVPDAAAFAAGASWRSAYGTPAAVWGDEHELLDERTYFRGVVHEDGVRVDYSIWPVGVLALITEAPVLPADLDVGYRVLLDKDGATASWRAPTHRAHIPAPPSEEEFLAVVDEFWWDTTAVAKGLWRSEVVFAKFALDFDAKFVALRRMLEWRIEIEHDWSLRPGSYGRGLERLLPGDVWAELSATYVGADVDDNWDALFKTAALFRRVAIEVAVALGYTYPHASDAAIMRHLDAVRDTPPRGKS
jgi:aminoglycoside 6-adenylyltransferase